jgi:hypothetical protein
VSEQKTSTRELNFPNANNEGQLRLLILDAFILLGESLGNHYDKKLRTLLGNNWLKDLALARKEYGYNLIDPDWVLKEPLRNSTSPTRLTLPKGQGFYNKINLLAKTRNAYFHNQAICTINSVKEILQYFLDLCLDIPLDHAATQYSQAIVRLDKLIAGEIFGPEPSGLTRIQLLEQQVAEMEELANAQKSEIVKKQYVLDAALDEVAIHAEKLREIEQMVGGKDQLIAQVLVEKKAAEEQAKQLQEEFDAKVAELNDKEFQEKQYKDLLAKLAENRTVASIQGQPNVEEVASRINLEPGSLWTGEKGARRLTLSVNFRELYDTKSGELLSEKHGAIATELAQEWLRIKPQGGRVFVDSAGVATAFQGENLIYLGRVTFELN